MPRTFLWLIIIWLLICASGLGVFLFEAIGPGTGFNDYEESPSLALAIGFWIFIWLTPTIILIVLARRHKS